MNWKERYEKNMIMPAAAAKMVKSGDLVYIPLHGPRLVHLEIAKRTEDLRDVEIHLARPAIAQVIDFTSQSGWQESFRIENEIFIGAENRWATDERKSVFNPVVFSLQFKP